MKRLASLLAAATCVVAFVASGGAQAAKSFPVAQCTGTVVVGRDPGTCTATFELEEARRPANLGTHANFHAALAMGSVTMEWIDPIHGTVAEWTCNAMGGHASVTSPSGDPFNVGVFDTSPHPNCTQRIKPAAAFARGTQLLVVTGTATACTFDRPQSSCLFHGALQLEPSYMPV